MERPTIKLKMVLIDQTNKSIRHYFQFSDNQEEVFCIDTYIKQGYFECTMGKRTIKTLSGGERYVDIEPIEQTKIRCIQYLAELHKQAQSTNNIIDYSDRRRTVGELNELFKYIVKLT